MKKLVKKVILGALMGSMIIGSNAQSFAACNPWHYVGSSTYCSTPMCNGTSTPTNYVSKKYERTCLNASNKPYTEQKSEVNANGCC